MKKLICTVSVFLLCISLISPIFASSTELPLLSEMSDSECIQFIKECGIVIPDDYSDETAWIPFIKNVIVLVEDNPDYIFGISYPVTLEFANLIKAAVNNYYGITVCRTDHEQVSTQATGYVLQHSSIHGSWVDEFLNYNCYAFAIGKNDAFYKPGDFSGQSYSISQSISTMANNVKKDLTALGYQNITVGTTRPTSSSLCSNERAICIRKGAYDYHFMKLSSGNWLHKPSDSRVLKYNYAPTTSRVWDNERAYRNTFEAPNMTYTSTIYYITYGANHSWDYIYYATTNGVCTHIKYCTICNEQTGAPQECVYTIANKCALCGHSKPTTPEIQSSQNSSYLIPLDDGTR